MAVQASQIERVFTYNGLTLTAPDESMTAEDVKAFYSATYGELVTAEIVDHGVKDDRQTFEFRRAVGSKG